MDAEDLVDPLLDVGPGSGDGGVNVIGIVEGDGEGVVVMLFDAQRHLCRPKRRTPKPRPERGLLGEEEEELMRYL